MTNETDTADLSAALRNVCEILNAHQIQIARIIEILSVLVDEPRLRQSQRDAIRDSLEAVTAPSRAAAPYLRVVGREDDAAGRS